MRSVVESKSLQHAPRFRVVCESRRQFGIEFLLRIKTIRDWSCPRAETSALCRQHRLPAFEQRNSGPPSI